MKIRIEYIGQWLEHHQKIIHYIQWLVIVLYAFLIIVPTALPLPTASARIFHNLTAFSQFIFWGIWWPFVLLSIVLFGRLWCGVFCPEGALSEFANNHGKRKAIPRWIRWRGWPFVAFSLTTLYGQLTSVYQYPKPTLLILGGSTLAAIVIGFMYGKSSRVWCQYLCPVSGVFSLLAKLAPIHFYTDTEKWKIYNGKKQIVRCPTLIPIKFMKKSEGCIMCGKCNAMNDAVKLRLRSPHEEIVKHGDQYYSIWPSILLVYGLLGIALGAFQWQGSIWFVYFRTNVDTWLLVHGWLLAFEKTAPWWIFTHYPARQDAFSWAFGCEVLIFILGTAVLVGSFIMFFLIAATKALGKIYMKRFQHIAQALIPLAACTVFIGLLGNTFTILQKYANLGFAWANDIRMLLVLTASIWSFSLFCKIISNYTISCVRFIASASCFIFILIGINYLWTLILI